MYLRVFTWRIHRPGTGRHASQSMFSVVRGSYHDLLGRTQVGLLPAGNHQQVPFAYKMFSRNDQTGWDQSKAFKKAFSIDVEIEFVGVWYAGVLTR